MTADVLRSSTPGGAAVQWESNRLGVPTPGIRILLRRLLPVPTRPHRSVLFVPGANSSADTFVLPGGGLVACLAARGCDVWMLDWRASPLVLDWVLAGPTLNGEHSAFSLDRMVAEDLPAALSFIRSQIADTPLAVHAHCVGGGGLAMAIARGLLEPYGVDRVVFSTLALFYEVSWNTWIKAEDFLLESILLPNDSPHCRAIDPRRPEAWPKVFQKAYERWPKKWLPGGNAASDQFLRRLSFMVGQPYSRERLDPSIDGPPVERIFGALHLGLYTHLGQMVRRGYAARLGEPDQIERTRLRQGTPARRAPAGDFSSLERFRPYRITLVAAGDNGVWHRDSIDLMHEWLSRNPRIHCEKHVIAGCNIQELYWGRSATKDTYGMFSAAVGA